MRMTATPPTTIPTMRPRLLVVVLPPVVSEVGALLGVDRPGDEDTMVGLLTVTPGKPELLNEVLMAAMVGELVRLEVNVAADQ